MKLVLFSVCALLFTASQHGGDESGLLQLDSDMARREGPICDGVTGTKQSFQNVIIYSGASPVVKSGLNKDKLTKVLKGDLYFVDEEKMKANVAEEGKAATCGDDCFTQWTTFGDEITVDHKGKEIKFNFNKDGGDCSHPFFAPIPSSGVEIDGQLTPKGKDMETTVAARKQCPGELDNPKGYGHAYFGPQYDFQGNYCLSQHEDTTGAATEAFKKYYKSAPKCHLCCNPVKVEYWTDEYNEDHDIPAGLFKCKDVNNNQDFLFMQQNDGRGKWTLANEYFGFKAWHDDRMAFDEFGE